MTKKNTNTASKFLALVKQWNGLADKFILLSTLYKMRAIRDNANSFIEQHRDELQGIEYKANVYEFFFDHIEPIIFPVL